MARMFPSRWLHGDDRSAGRMAEGRVYEALAKLPQEFAVYHGVQFQVRRDNDPRLHDVEIDFLVTHPDFGVLVLEVKAGPVEVRDREWGRGEHGNWRSMSDPIAQLRDHKHDLQRFMAGDARWRWPRFLLSGGVAFPDQPKMWPLGSADAPRDIVLTGASIGRMQQWLERCFEFHWGANSPEGAREVGILVHQKFNTSILLSSDLRGIADSVASSEEQLREATERQLAALNGLRCNRRVQISGPAGSGKTLLAMKRAAEVADAGEGRVLYTCFNQPLARYVQNQLSGHDNVTVFHFHKLVEQLARRAGHVWSPPRDGASHAARSEWWTEGIAAVALDALASLPDVVFDAVIVDEAQDFHPQWWIVLELLLRDAKDSCFWVFGDDNQRIYPHGATGPEIPFKFQLTENLRNTQRIFSTFRHLVDDDRAISRGPLGEPVQWITHAPSTDSLEALDGVVSLLLASGIATTDVVVLSGLGGERTKLRDLSSIAGNRICRLDPGVARAGLTWETVRRFKGLEAPVIVLVEVNHLATSLDRELQYVALSRAGSLLIVVGSAQEIGEMRARSR